MTSDTIAAIPDEVLEKSPRGLSCIFVPLDEIWGAKIYLSHSVAYENQKGPQNLG